MTSEVVASESKPVSLIAKMAGRYGVDADKMLATLKATAFKGNVTTEQMMALCIVADQYGLNPWTKEIYAFPDRNNGIVPVVGVDGWSRIINSDPQFDGMEFEQDDAKCTCKIFRKDRSHAIAVTEWMEECKRDGVGPWKTHPKRMLRHKAMIQCARIAFGFVGIYDEDEGERIKEAIDITPTKVDPRGDLSGVDGDMVARHVATIVDLMNQDKEDYEKAQDLRDFVEAHFNGFHEIYIAVMDELKRRQIITRAKWDEYLKIMPISDDGHVKMGREHA